MNPRPLALVTGGSGYFGSLLAQQLRRRGQAVRILDINDTDDRPPEVEFIQADIRDEAAVRRAVEGAQQVFHNVAQVPLAKDRHLFESVNVGGTQTLLSAAQAAGVAKLVHTSSSAVFGVPKTNPVTEDTSPTPGESYGQAKLRAEELCRRYAAQGLDVTIIRPRTILGHGRLGIFQILFEWIREGANIPVLGKGDNVYQFVHADDLADACIRASQRAGSSIYNCGAAQFGTMRQGLEALCRHAATGSKIRNVPMRPAVWAMKLTSALGLSPLGPYHALMYGRSLYFDISRAQSELGWQPRYSNEQMLIESYEWYTRHREKILAGGGSRHRSAVRQGILRLVRWML
jgi:nucleoside-diphosphate-sugar epimerase